MCEDYPCCGHAIGECNDTTDYAAIHFARMSRDDYDPYYDEQ